MTDRQKTDYGWALALWNGPGRNVRPAQSLVAVLGRFRMSDVKSRRASSLLERQQERSLRFIQATADHLASLIGLGAASLVQTTFFA